MKNILVLGADGYIGRPLSLDLKRRGHKVYGLDDFRRRWRAESLVELSPNYDIDFSIPLTESCLAAIEELDVIIHLAQQPSAPWSMRDCDHAVMTQQENVIGNLKLLWTIKEHFPDAHLIKLGTMGEYGTPDIDIPEGFIDDPCEDVGMGGCPLSGMMFPRDPNSFYHLSKVFDSMNINFACKTWGIKATDIMQGIVFGLNYWDKELTRFDYDQYFGTVINRFCAQAVAGIPLTVYGTGGQIRSFLPLEDSIKCINLVIDNPPEPGTYRVFNQYAECKTIYGIAAEVVNAGVRLGMKPTLSNIKNPRTESEQHFYQPKNDGLRELGYFPEWNLPGEIEKLINAILPCKDRINKSIIEPTTTWK